MSSAYRRRRGAWLVPVWLSCAVARAASRTSLRPYRSEDLEFQMKVPKGWAEVRGDMMVGFRSQTGARSASIGVYRQAQKDIPIQVMAHRSYETWKRPKDWSQHLIWLGKLQAMEIEMQPDRDLSRRILLFFVDAQKGYWGYYLIECQAPVTEWAEQKALFEAAVQSFQNI